VPDIRRISGLGLKAEIEKNFAYLTMPVIDYVKERLLLAFYDPDEKVRKTVSSIMSTLIVKGGFYIWPNLIEFLTNNLLNADHSVIENSIQALSIIIEDSQGLFEDEKFHKMIDNMLPKIFGLLGSGTQESIKKHALNTVNMLLVTRTPSINKEMENYMNHIISIAVNENPSSEIKWRIVQGIVTIADMDVDIVLKMENFTKIASLMLISLKNREEPRVA
jgi:non-SMC mitotic condensation complex subunit 1